MASRSFVVVNVPEMIDKESYLTDYLEAVLDKEVEQLQFLPQLPDRALFTLHQTIDGEKAAVLISENLLEGHQLGIEASLFSDAVVAEGEDLIEKVTPFFVKQYFQNQFGDSKEIVSRCVAVADCEMVVVCFEDSEVLADILKDPIHYPLPSVGYEMKVGQFCDNFHGLIPHGNKLLCQVIDDEGDNSNDEQDSPVSPACHTKATQSQDGDGSTEQEAMVREISFFDLNEKFEVEKNLTRSTVYANAKTSTDTQSKAAIFDPASISELPAGQISSRDATLDNHVYPSESLFSQHYTSLSFGLSAQELEKTGHPQSHSFFQTCDLEHKKDVPKPVQGEIGPQKIDFPLKQSHWYLLKELLRSMDVCSVDYDAGKEMLTFETLSADDFDLEAVEDLVADVIESHEKLPDSMAEVFGTTHGKKYLKSYMLVKWSDAHDVFVDLQDGFILCCGLDEEKIDDAKQTVKSDLFSLVEVDNKSLVAEAVEDLKQSLENKYKVHIFWNEETAKKIQIRGVKDDVIAVKKLIQTTVNDNTTTTKCFEFSEDVSAYIVENCQEDINDILKNVESCVDPSHDKFSITYSGSLQEIRKVSSALDDIRSTLTSEEFEVANEFSTDEANLILKELSLLSPDGFFQNTHDLFMAKHKCLILNSLEEDSDTQSCLSGPSAKPQKKVRSRKPRASKEAIFVLNPRMLLKIKQNGNIIRERSDVLVCVLEESRQLTKTNVSKAFLSVQRDLQNTVDNLSLSPNGVELVPFRSHNINSCKAIVFVTLSVFEQGTTEDCLQRAVVEVLVKAAEFKATSVSFPPLGLGRVMKYPEDVISQQFFSAVKEFVENHSSQHQLQKIKLLASSRSLFFNLNNKGKTLFRKIIKNKDTKEEEDSSERGAQKDHGLDGGDDLPVTSANIRIIHQRPEGLASRWKTKLKNYVNHEEEIDTLLESFPKSLDHKIKTKLKTIPVLITTRMSKLGHLVVKVRGAKDRVMQMKAYIAEEIVKEGKGQSQSSLSASSAPKRGSVAFMKYVASINLSVPIYWKRKDGSDSSLHKVSDKTKQSIEKLLLATWNSAQVGVGRDAVGIPTSAKLEFVSVQRIECPTLYILYTAFRKGLLERKVREHKVCQSIKEISSSKQPALTSVNLPDFMKQELCGEVNECYLFHGTKQEVVDPIIKQGCHPSLTNSSAMFGKGVYAAESSTKADQYTDDPASRLPSGSIHSMFLLRMLLGDVFRCTKKHPSVNGKDSDKLVRPPCKKCYKDKCTCGDNFDSVMGEDGWIFREFVVYHPAQCYPEYLIKYKRVH